MNQNDPQAAGRAALRQAIERSGLSARAYAERVLTRDERTIRRWQAGDAPIPREVLRFLEAGAPAHVAPLDRAMLLEVRDRLTGIDDSADLADLVDRLERFLEVEAAQRTASSP